MRTTPNPTETPKEGGGPTAEGWFAGGERVGYDAKARALVAGEGAPLRVFLKREGDVAHAVSFLPGYPDGSFGWAKVYPHLPSATEMPKLFVEYVGMGDSDKPQDYAYSTAERTDLVEAIWRDLVVLSTTLVAFDIGSLVVLNTCAGNSSACSAANALTSRKYAECSSSMAGSSPTATPIHGSPRRSCAAFRAERRWDSPSRSSSC